MPPHWVLWRSIALQLWGLDDGDLACRRCEISFHEYIKGLLVGGALLLFLVTAVNGDGMIAKDLKKQLGRKNAPLIVDVRSRIEYLNGHIPGALHIPFWAILWRHKPISKDPQRQTVIYCEHGPRAVLARGLLALVRKGDVALLEGHMVGWRCAGLPMRRGDKVI